jgi:acetyltransferase-like isoleucine patch superfamily enzyme
MGELKMGIGSYGSMIRRGVHNSITVGNYCSIAEGCICDGGFGHNTKFVTTYPLNVNMRNCGHLTGHPVWKGDIFIGNDVWIGENCMLMSGITIGDGAVIGARSIVTKNIPPYTIAVGSPARVTKKRFTDDQIEKLLKIKWWDWDEQKIVDNAHLLMNTDIDNFISLHH